MIVTVTLNPSLDEWVQLPSLRVGELNRATAVARDPGGKGINVSRVVQELGGQTVAIGVAGGEDGAIFRRLLARLGIPNRLIWVAGPTRNNYKIRTERPRGLTEINTAGPDVSQAALHEVEQRLLEGRPRPRCIVLSGSLPPGVPSTIYQRWVHLLRRDGIPVALDSSGEALRHGLAARPWLVKPNCQEAEELLRRRLGGQRDAVRATQEILRRGPRLVILSRGKAGALLALADPPGVWTAIPPVVSVNSAVGAGDSLVGGFLAGWARGQSLLEAFRLGVASGSAAAMTPGTELCHRKDVRRLLDRVVIRRLV